jgi:hypothetical protein
MIAIGTKREVDDPMEDPVLGRGIEYSLHIVGMVLYDLSTAVSTDVGMPSRDVRYAHMHNHKVLPYSPNFAYVP